MTLNAVFFLVGVIASLLALLWFLVRLIAPSLEWLRRRSGLPAGTKRSLANQDRQRRPRLPKERRWPSPRD